MIGSVTVALLALSAPLATDARRSQGHISALGQGLTRTNKPSGSTWSLRGLLAKMVDEKDSGVEEKKAEAPAEEPADEPAGDDAALTVAADGAPAEAPVEVPVDDEAGVVVEDCINLVDLIADTPDLSTLGTAAEASGLVEEIAGPTAQFTIFAPSNAAFGELGQDEIDSLIADKEMLTSVCLHFPASTDSS